MSEIEIRQRLKSVAKKIVIKVGTRVLTRDGRVDYHQIQNLVGQIAQLKLQGRKVILVSSGAVGTAMTLLDRHRPNSLGELQAFAAIGQAELIHHYNKALVKFDLFAAQVLLTADDIHHRQRYLNLRNTFFSLFELGAVPIVNENDCVATDEIAVTFGDNDRLATMVAMLVDADLLFVLSDVDGLYDRSPAEPDAQLIPFVGEFTNSILDLPGDAAAEGGELSKGGMASKIQAAQMATNAGILTVIAGGRVDNVVPRILGGERCGTLFDRQEKKFSSWKRWLTSSPDCFVGIVVDPGAISAICEGGKSLLPIGVLSVIGEFKKGELIFIKALDGKVIARGITNFSSEETRKIAGSQSSEISRHLGQAVNKEVIHRNNLVLT